MAKAIIEIAAAVFTLAGVIVGVHGTYLLTLWYHPFTTGGFMASVRRMVWRKVRGKNEEISRHLRVESALAKMRPEDKSRSLNGIYWVFIGFLLQAFGAILTVIDAALVNFGNHQ